MTTALTTHPPTAAAGDQVELALTLELDPESPTALLRVVAALHRRRCRVTEADYRSLLSGCDRLELRLRAPRAHAHCVEAWLAALLEVRHVTARHHAAPDS
ncbi:MAG: hypothetical protein ABSH51_13945 [Solirubrobacteraceae bacterium]